MRRFTFGTRDGRKLPLVCDALHGEPRHGTVTTRRLKWDKLRQRPRSTASLANFGDALAAQGLPPDFLSDAPFTQKGKDEVVGNGVPLPMGRAIARAVRAAFDRDCLAA